MSSIKIVCRKDVKKMNKKNGYDKGENDSSIDGELIIEANQWFMNTESFFDNVKDCLSAYFKTIEKVKK